MKDCLKIKKLIPGMFDRETAAADKSAVLSHLVKCRDCAEYYKEIQMGVNLLRNIPHEEVPRALHGCLMAKLAEAPAETSSFRFSFNFPRVPAYALSCAFAALFIFYLSGTFNSPVRYYSGEGYIEKHSSVESLSEGKTGYIKLNLKSGKLLENVKMETTLPEGIVLANGKKTAVWKGDLKKGNNAIVLKVRGKKAGQWRMNGLLTKNGMQKRFSKNVTVL